MYHKSKITTCSLYAFATPIASAYLNACVDCYTYAVPITHTTHMYYRRRCTYNKQNDYMGIHMHRSCLITRTRVSAYTKKLGQRNKYGFLGRFALARHLMIDEFLFIHQHDRRSDLDRDLHRHSITNT